MIRSAVIVLALVATTMQGGVVECADMVDMTNPTGDGVTVAVIDTGLNEDYVGAPDKVIDGRCFYYREEADGACMINDNGVTKRCGYYSSGYTNDDNGHGTMVSAVIADVAPGVTIMPMRAFTTAPGYIGGKDSVLGDCIRYAAENGADIINMSFSTDEDSAALRSAIEAAADAGCILIASAGNDGTYAYQYPAAYQQVISVGAVDKQGNIATFSQKGEWVDVYARGKNVHFVGEAHGAAGKNGTSLAAPMVSGAAALAMEAYPDMTKEEFLELLKRSCDPVEDQTGGILNMERLLEMVREMSTWPKR